MSSRPTALLFDWDNTLVDSWGVLHATMNETLAAMGQATWSRAEAEQRIRASMRDSFPILFGERWPEAEKIFYSTYERLHIDTLQACPGAEELLAWAAESGFYMGVVSNKRGAFLRAEATALGWNRYFRKLAGAGDAARDKPAREHVEAALVPGEMTMGAHIWFIGDTDIDLLCARNTGCVGVLVRAQPPAEGEFAELAPDHYFPDLAALRAALANR
ncbi:HAD family hydrolase [Dongia sp.]|uniref:HAD family hydrolase n=1 Tax=Dongia sp. TaxID=1977262 RepID=UPI0035B152DC